MLDALGPTEVRNMNQAINAFFDLDESAEVRELADAAFHHRANTVT